MTDGTKVDLSILDMWPVSSWEYPRVLVGIPLERAISYAERVFFRFMAIASQGPAFVEMPYGRIDLVRNIMVQKFLTTDFTHLLMLDIDHEHDPYIIQKLAKWALIRPEVKIVSGLNFRRKAPFDPVAGIYSADKSVRQTMYEWDPGLVEVDETGAASLLVHRDVFLEIEPPWFTNIYDEVLQNNWPGEDIGFCRKAKAAGFKIFVDTTVSSPHCTDIVVTEETFRIYVAGHPNEMRISDETP